MRAFECVCVCMGEFACVHLSVSVCVWVSLRVCVRILTHTMHLLCLSL